MFNFAEAASENPTFYADLTNPQSLNKYQYTYNNPLNMVDPDGHCPDCPGLIIIPPKTIVAIITNPLDSAQAALSVVGLIPGAGEVADVANAGISVARGNYGEAALDLSGALGPVGSGVAVGNRIRKIAKAASKADDVVEAGADVSTGLSKGMTAKKAANLAEADRKGIPRDQLGPSGKPKILTAKHPTGKRAQDAAQARSKGPLIKHVNPSKGRSHYHATDKSGKKRSGKQNIHDEYPR